MESNAAGIDADMNLHREHVSLSASVGAAASITSVALLFITYASREIGRGALSYGNEFYSSVVTAVVFFLFFFFSPPAVGKLVSEEEVKGQRWASWSGVLGSEVSGIWPKYSAQTEINAVDANPSAAVLITGDDLGLVKLFRFPCVRKGLRLLRLAAPRLLSSASFLS